MTHDWQPASGAAVSAEAVAVTYEVCVQVQPQAVQDWLNWMRSTHIPDVVAQEGFWGATIEQRIDPADDTPTFVIRYRVASEAALERYQAGPATRLQQSHREHFGTVAHATRRVFRTVQTFYPAHAPQRG
ncbi:MAG: DUF4286 family protein [Candidatus Melainabacteria bacterium]|nr:DUF4286 family protein [Candidatus Melainabacteria bacterium]